VISVICFSGGKDSTALLLWARRAFLRPCVDPYRVIFCDTGWEHPLTLGYVEHVSTVLDVMIEHLHGKETFEERVRRLRGFPSSGKRWCTDELKIQPTARYLDKLREETGDEVQVLTGIRAEESRSRAKMPEREWFDAYDCEQWRPLLHWTLADVIQEHHRAGLELNPLYKLGAERVGCWPCINAGKTEIELVARIDPARIDRIREMEKITKNTMFSKEAPVKLRVPGEKRHELPLPIDEAVEWSRTTRGGKQIQLVRPATGCMRWGICDG
jgi:3'-phosphoadenosine 5'-phosphosulfate sulfotransferase (PAPS reductase)/FAD synthetase